VREARKKGKTIGRSSETKSKKAKEDVDPVLRAQILHQPCPQKETKLHIRHTTQ